MKATRLLITGRVQGVGFRLFTERAARRLGVHGHVRNLPDGSVEAVAAADADRLRILVDRLSEGPIGSRVDHVETSDTSLDDDVQGFEILP